MLGGEKSLLAFLDNVSSSLVQPMVVAPAGGELERQLLLRGIPRLDWPRGGRRNITRLSAQLQGHCDLVHANSLMTAAASSLLSKSIGVPAIAHIRDIMNLSDRHWETLASLEAVVAVSEAVASWLKQRVPANSVHRIYNGVDRSRWQASKSRDETRAEWSLTARDFVVGCIGQFAIRKGQDVFLEAASLLAGKFDHLRLMMVGTRYSQKDESVEYERRLRALAKHPSLNNKAIFTGYQTNMADLIASLDLVVVPSRQEPLSRVALESLALNVPVIASDVGGSAEILDHGRLGKLVEPDDVQALAVAMQEVIINDQPRRKAMGGADWIEAKFNVTSHVSNVVQLYQSVTV